MMMDRTSDLQLATFLVDNSNRSLHWMREKGIKFEHEKSVPVNGKHYFEPGAVIVETGKPDEFYGGLTDLVASGACGAVEEVTSPDDNLQAVFQYLVKT